MKINKERIEMLLVERDITRTELAANSGISRQNISTILRRGTCEPKTAGKLARGLGVPVESIIGSEKASTSFGSFSASNENVSIRDLGVELFAGKVCPIIKQCKGAQCAWWCDSFQECAIPLLASAFTDRRDET